MVHETNNLNYLSIRGYFSKEELTWLWEKMFDEYIQAFGLNQEFITYFNKKKKLQLLENRYALTKKASLKNLIKFRRKELDAINPTENEKSNYMDVVIAVEKSINRNISEKTISVRKFYTYLHSIKNGKAVKR